MTDNILTELASGDYYEVVRQRLPWIESTILEPRRVVEALRISPAYIETTVEVLEMIWGSQKWHPASEPPDDDRMVMLRFDPEGKRDRWGVYAPDYGAYAFSTMRAVKLQFVHPTHWRELKED